MDYDDNDLDGLGRYKQTCPSWVWCFWGHNHHDGMWQDSLIECHQSEMDDDEGKDDWYKQVWWSDVSHINVCEGIRTKITRNVKERWGWMGGKKEGKRVLWVGRRLHLVRRSDCFCWGYEGNESVMMNEMKWGWKGIGGWCCCQRCLDGGRWVDWNWGPWMKGGKEWGIMRREWEEEMKQDFWDWWRLIDGVIPMSLIEGPLWCGMEMRMKRDWKRDLRRVRSLKASEGMKVRLLEYKECEILDGKVWMWNDDWVWGQVWSDCWVHWKHQRI